MRFVAASLVLFSHSYPLLGHSEPIKALIGMSFGGIAVDIFFVTSGFLIAGSFWTGNNIIRFVWARILRIFPALFVAVLFCTFVIGLFFTTNSIPDYLTNLSTYKYIIKNVNLFGEWNIICLECLQISLIKMR